MKKAAAPLMINASGCLWETPGIFVRRFDLYGVKVISIVFLRTV